jgi:peptidylprolyl isomerase
MRSWFAKLLAVVTGLFTTLQAGESMTNENQTVVLETNHGVIEIKLFKEAAPKTCENFVKLVEKDYYNGVPFHRVIKSFMIQGGDPTGTGAGGESVWGKPFTDEFSPTLKFDRHGILAMANRGPNTNGSQFFITTIATPWLNMKHTIFGEVAKGYDIVQKIEQTKTMQDRPIDQIVILKAYLK